MNVALAVERDHESTVTSTRDVLVTSKRCLLRSSFELAFEFNASNPPISSGKVNQVGVHHTVSAHFLTLHLVAQDLRCSAEIIRRTRSSRTFDRTPPKAMHLVHTLHSALTKYGIHTKNSSLSVSSLEILSNPDPFSRMTSNIARTADLSKTSSPGNHPFQTHHQNT